MTAEPGAATRDVTLALARADHERAVELVDVTAVLRALSGSPAVLTALERDVVVVLPDRDGISRQIVAEGLGITRHSVDDAICRQRRRVPALTRDLWAAAMLRPAADLVSAVRANDPVAVARVLVGLDCQRLAALAVDLARLQALMPHVRLKANGPRNIGHLDAAGVFVVRPFRGLRKRPGQALPDLEADAQEAT